jgi:RND family efflux transporter MFP subunit
MKILSACLVVALLMGGGYYWWGARTTAAKTKTSAEVPVEVKVTRGGLSVTVESTGRVVPEQEVDIKCKASGEVVKLPVDVSDHVAKGDLLAQLDPEDEQRNVKQAGVSLAVSESQLEQAKLALSIAERNLVSGRLRAEAALQSAQVKAADADARMERVRQLREKKIASDEELDSARSTQAQTAASLKDAQAGIEDLQTQEIKLDTCRHDIKIAEQRVEENRLSLDDAKKRLTDTTVTAPIDGVVASRNVQVGQIIASGVSNVGGGTSMFTIMDLSRVYVLVSVDESDIGRIVVGQQATITVDAYPDRRLKGEVVRVATKGATTSNVVTFEVKVEVTGRQKNLLKPEMTANVSITAVDKENVLLLPVAAVKRRGPKSFVTIKTADGKTEEKPVVVGDSDGKMMEIAEGLVEGDAVVMSSGGNSRWNSDKQRSNGTRPPRMPHL